MSKDNNSGAHPGNGQSGRLPRKRFYRARAHSNPLSDSHFPIPLSPADVDYAHHFPHFFAPAEPDRGNGMALSPKVRFADVTEYVKDRILALRDSNPGKYENISVVRTNSMKYIPNYFEKGQLSKMFFLFPDPHFKEKNHRRRVISPQLLDEYAYVMEIGGVIYTITDVEELGDWMRSCLEEHPLFEAVSEEELETDPVVKLLSSATEEGQKVARNGGQTFKAVYRRVALHEE
ncbi:tRNA (guanine-N(7)-)-methyltransferase [Ananas comosus]|uniref:tRNA (guanine-N(7)-)-methyltransferase n=1 Tax=Ananas comosus TaxID=4615 RepID=A0A199VQH6_ANACO|nr:tRNA (guanine-N(7)-)-methyltransferase [Ananas comosus]